MRFKYVQIGCKDINKMVDFYKKTLDFSVSDETKWLNGKEGVVLKAPGFGDDGVVFGFIKAENGVEARQINDRGFAHVCFETIDVRAAIDRFVRYGGKFQSTLKSPRDNPCVYCKDIEGNVVEFHIPFTSKDSNLFNTLTCLLHLRKDNGIRKELGHSGIKFIHVNIITEDYRKLCDFYNDTFGSVDTGKIKDHSGNFKEQVIGVKDVHVLGKHVLLPGFYASYPTLEIFQYSIKGTDQVANETSMGINMIGFKSLDLESDLKYIIENGGKEVRRIDDSKILVSDYQDGLILLSK